MLKSGIIVYTWNGMIIYFPPLKLIFISLEIVAGFLLQNFNFNIKLWSGFSFPFIGYISQNGGSLLTILKTDYCFYKFFNVIIDSTYLQTVILPKLISFSYAAILDS
jgi:hypothetical protein